VAINVEDDYSGLQKSGNYICNNVNAGSGTPATASVVSGIGYSTDCSGLSSTRMLPASGTPSLLNTGDSTEWVRIYPNPVVQNSIMLSLQNGKKGRVIVSIIDVNGRIVQKNMITKDNTVLQQLLPLTHLSRGMYLVKLQFENEGKPYIFKLIRE
jgi:hypothetical protein